MKFAAVMNDKMPPMNSLTPSSFRWDILCSVVDNYGDIGISWRVARQLVLEHGQRVRLWVDDLVSFQHICPELNPALDTQSVRGVEVRRWSDPFPEIAPEEVGDIVVEAFACTLPDSFLNTMAARPHKPVWINLEYLSAEAWVDGCHAMASPHPQLPLTKYFFFPGFTAKTGGLLREHDLLQRRRAFQADPLAQADFWQSLGLPPHDGHELRLSLFGYDTPLVVELAQVWSEGERPVRCLALQGALAHQLVEWFGHYDPVPGDSFSRGNLTVHLLPFLEQDRYDQLLWGCDLNFVRGEDSFVRAQWAGRPLVWQAYRQEEGSHLVKLEAFLERYCATMAAEMAVALRTFWQAWNRGEGVAAAWPAFIWECDGYLQHSERWLAEQVKLGDTVTNLMHFCQKSL